MEWADLRTSDHPLQLCLPEEGCSAECNDGSNTESCIDEVACQAHCAGAVAPHEHPAFVLGLAWSCGKCPQTTSPAPSPLSLPYCSRLLQLLVSMRWPVRLDVQGLLHPMSTPHPPPCCVCPALSRRLHLPVRALQPTVQGLLQAMSTLFLPSVLPVVNAPC